MSTSELLRVIHEEDRAVFDAVGKALPEIARTVDAVAGVLAGDGRLIYVGAGTSGRLGVLDAAECPPTFGIGPDRVIALMAGGPEAVFTAREGVEDDSLAGQEELRALEPTRSDLVVGIAASGVTPYVRGALHGAREAGARTVFLTCGDGAGVSVDTLIQLETGPEVLAGSTRMKAGTATKLVLNMITTAAMVRIGKVYDNRMVDVKVASRKLRDRAERLVSGLAGLSMPEAATALDGAHGEVKAAVIMARHGIDYDEAHRLLRASGGFLRGALEGGTA